MFIRLLLLVGLASFSLVSNLAADSVAALPGLNSNATSVVVFGVNPLESLSSPFNAGDGAFIILPKPDGSKYYVVAKSGTNTVMTVDTNFQNPKLVASLQSVATGAALTPDGSKLAVAAGTLHVFDTTKDQDIVPGGISTGDVIFDVAVSLDGKRAYALGTTSSGGSQLNAIDLTANTATGLPSYGILGTATAVSVGLNGRVYVSTQNQIIEIDPTTLQPTPGGIIGVNALPEKLVFTPDSKYALTVNHTPITGSAILLIDLTAHSVVNFISNTNLNVEFDTLLVANSTTVFAYSSANQGLYQLGIGAGGSIAIGVPAIGGLPSTAVEGVAISNELPFAGNSTAHYLFVASAGTLYRVDLTVGPQITAQTALSNQQFGALEYIALPSTSASEVLLAYGDKQNIAPNAKSLPLVVRALDTSGRPVIGATITFSASVNTASVSPASATTGAGGFAETILTAPPTNGNVTVTATDGKHPFGFTITVGSTTTPNSGNLTLIAGQGQILPSEVNSAQQGRGSALTVMLSDLNGKPIIGGPVTFAITPGPGSGGGQLESLAGFSTSGIPNGLVVKTNSKGLASVSFQTSVVPTGLGNTQTTITAKGTGTNTITFFETVYPANPPLPPTVHLVNPTIGSSLSGPAGTILKAAFTAILVDDFAEPLPNVSIQSCIPGPPSGPGQPVTCGAPPAGTVPFGTCNDPTGQGVLSDGHGHITCDLLLNGVVGSGTIGVIIGFSDVFGPFNLKITPGLPGAINILQGNNQTGKPGQQLPLALLARVSDSFGNVLPDTPVTFTVLNTGVPATLQNSSTATDPNGDASTLVTLGATAGTVIIQLTAGNASASFSLTVSNPAAGIQVVSGNNQTALISTLFAAPLVVKVVDGQGNGVSGAAVTFTITSGNATIGTPSAVADASGQASTSVTAGSTAGNIVITATSGNFSTTFTLSSHMQAPQNIVFVNGASFRSNCPAPGCLAPGEVVTVHGSGFATGVQGVVSGTSILGPLPTTLAGVSITFNGVAAPIFYIANVNGVESMSVQVPFETQVGTAAVVLNGADGGSANLNITIQPFAPGVFTTAYGNQVIAVAVRSDGSYVSPNNPAHLGETIYLFVTGLGEVSPAAATNQPGSGQLVTGTVVTGLNNKGVPHGTVDYAPGLVGVYIVAIKVPMNTLTGPAQPVGLILIDANGTKYYAQSTNIPISQ